MKTKHLDIGCGINPRNPFSRDMLYGIDIINVDNSEVDFEYIKSDVVLEKLPFEDSFFDSISCYDFLEHIPRTIHRNSKLEFSFIEFMNEVHRVLKPKGIFYALTPGYPDQAAFVDPTHVNFITSKTHKYFTLPKLRAKAYGFKGSFKLSSRVKWIKVTNELEKNSFRKFLKSIFYFFLYKHRSHLMWKFECIK